MARSLAAATSASSAVSGLLFFLGRSANSASFSVELQKAPRMMMRRPRRNWASLLRTAASFARASTSAARPPRRARPRRPTPERAWRAGSRCTSGWSRCTAPSSCASSRRKRGNEARSARHVGRGSPWKGEARRPEPRSAVPNRRPGGTERSTECTERSSMARKPTTSVTFVSRRAGILQYAWTVTSRRAGILQYAWTVTSRRAGIVQYMPNVARTGRYVAHSSWTEASRRAGILQYT